MPRVIVLNILDFNLRKAGEKFHQVAELMYREPPYERATDKFEIHNLELPRFRELKPDYTNPLHNWLTALCRAQEMKKSLMEVIEMEPQLREFYDIDPGFAQFVERHGIVASKPELREEYKRWEYDQVLEALETKRTEERGIAIGKVEGKAERDIEIAIKAFEGSENFHETSRLLQSLGISDEVIKLAQSKAQQMSKERSGGGLGM